MKESCKTPLRISLRLFGHRPLHVAAHAIAVLTEWDEFKALDFARILASMPKPAFIFDGRNILDLPKLRALGFQAFGIGK